MHIGIVGPIATQDVAHLLERDPAGLPAGYAGAPLLASLIAELWRRGHHVSAFTLSGDMALDAGATLVARGARFDLHYCPMRPRAWQPNGRLPGRIVDLYRFEREGLRQAIVDAAPSVIHAHWVYEFALAALATNIPHVITCHDSPLLIARMYSRSRPTRSLYRWLRVLMARRTLRAARYVTAVSPYMRDSVQRMASVPVAVVPNPVDPQALSLAGERTAAAAPRLAMVCNGWDRRKNPQPALLAFAQLRAASPAAELHLYGHDFGVGETAERWCAERGIGAGMVFHGALRHADLLRALAAADLLMHSSLEESFGMVLAEAMAIGLPVVAGQASGAVPWVVGECGQLCDVRDAGEIARALRAALEPERYASLSRGGIASVRARFSTPGVVDAYFALYQQALDQGAAPSALAGGAG